MKHLYTIVFIFALFLNDVYATHAFGGFLTAKHNFGYNYKITVTTYTNEYSNSDRNSQNLYFSNGDSLDIPRTNGGGSGVLLGNGIRCNIFEGTYTFPGVNIYTIRIEDPNRNSGILNVPNAVETPFVTLTKLFVFNPAIDCVSNSVDFANLPIIHAQAGGLYKSDVPLIFSDDDSLSYSLTECLGTGGLNIAGYTFPTGASIDSKSGKLTWNVPATIGQFNFAVKVKKWRKKVFVGESIFDFLIVTKPSINNPIYCNFNQICSVDADSNYICTIYPGSILNINAAFVNTTMTEYSEINNLQNPGVFSTGANMANFNWVPNNSNSRNHPYKITFRASQLQGNNIVCRDYIYLIYVSGISQNTCLLPQWLTVNETSNTSNLFSIYPNPNNGIFTLKSNMNEQNTYTITDILGKEIQSLQINSEESVQIDLSNYAKGVYNIRVASTNSSETKHILVQ